MRPGIRCSTGVRRLVALVACATLGLALSAATNAGTPPKGDPQAIVAYDTEVAHYAGPIPGVKIVETGYFSGTRTQGNQVSITWGRPTPPGYVPEKATIVETLLRGKIVSYYAALTAPKLPRFRVVMSQGSVFVSSTSCWNPTKSTSSPLGTGQDYLWNDGGAIFAPLGPKGAQGGITLSYVWSAGSHAKEIDTFTAGARPKAKVTITVTGAEKMNVVKTVTPLYTPPKLPSPAPPAPPAPHPLCAN